MVGKLPNKLFQFVPGLMALHRTPFSLRYKGAAEQNVRQQ